jgi:Tol biopolymer transport system component
MTRSPRDNRSSSTSPREPGSAVSSMLAGAQVAVLLSVVGLVLIGLGTFALGSGDLPFSFSGSGNNKPGASGGGGGNGVSKTPTPSNIVVVPTEAPGIKVPGSLVYAKDGNIWVESNMQATQLTTGGKDAMPSFTPDGTNVIFIRTRYIKGLWKDGLGQFAYYAMDVPSIWEVPTAGGNAKKLLDGAYNPPGKGTWMAWLREPVLSPNGHTIAMATDLPNPSKNGADVTIKFYDLNSNHLSDPNLADVAPLGHQDPAWRPDGKVLAYVYNNRDGATGVPQIYAYSVALGTARAISGPGYLHPSWSPDGKYLAVTKTSAYGTDVAILNATSGAEVALLTNDGSSWAPTWSPAGDQVAYLHANGQVVDLELVALKGNYGDWTPGDVQDLTTNAGLDSISRPDWFVPADQIPAATAAPGGSSTAPSTAPSDASASPSPS